jgi:hypothetical protein
MDEFGMSGSRMMGYWSPSCPVRTDNPNVLASAYINQGKVLIALASWDPKPADVKLIIDWEALGLDPANSALSASSAKGFQSERKFGVTDRIPIEPGKGWLLVLAEKR